MQCILCMLADIEFDGVYYGILFSNMFFFAYLQFLLDMITSQHLNECIQYSHDETGIYLFNSIW